MKKTILIIVSIILFAIPFPSWIYSIVKGVRFDANCGNYLELAGDANSIELAEKHLSKAITYLEENKMTSGDTRVVIYYPKNDVGLWYENLKTAQLQLQEMIRQGNASDLEKSNMLMKLRETLLNEGGSLIIPYGVSRLENFQVTFWLNITLWLVWIPASITTYYACQEDYLW